MDGVRLAFRSGAWKPTRKVRLRFYIPGKLVCVLLKESLPTGFLFDVLSLDLTYFSVEEIVLKTIIQERIYRYKY